MKNIAALIVFLILSTIAYSQVLLDANGDGNTYELITSVLAPNGNPIETPDCSHTEFGNHIDMVFNDDLGTYVFRFHIHKTPDNDKCSNFDRQRNEIKTYSESPDNLLGTTGETVQYKWKFKIDADFQASSSFTHLHQIKAVGGEEEKMPLITLTARKGNPDKLELRYAEHLTQKTLHKVDLSLFKGHWVQVTETITYGETGSYSIKITNVTDKSTLMEYSNNSIRMWKTDAEFIRPKWGIYRSLNNKDDLRDEIVLFANFSITENPATGFEDLKSKNRQVNFYPNPTKSSCGISFDTGTIEKVYIYGLNGILISGKNKIDDKQIDLSGLEKGTYFAKLYTSKGLFFSKVLKE